MSDAQRTQAVLAAILPGVVTGESDDPWDDAGRILEGLRRRGFTVHRDDDPCQLLPILPAARLSDPSTSHDAAKASLPGRRSQAWRLLLTYNRLTDRITFNGLTAHEVVHSAGLPVGAWRRVSDLLGHELLEVVTDEDGRELTRAWRGGMPSRVLRISSKGEQYARQGLACGWPA